QAPTGDRIAPAERDGFPHGWLSLHTLRVSLILVFHVGSFGYLQRGISLRLEPEPQSVRSSMKLLERKCSWKGRPALSSMSAGALVRLCRSSWPNSARMTCRRLHVNWQVVTGCWLWPQSIPMCGDSREETDSMLSVQTRQLPDQRKGSEHPQGV